MKKIALYPADIYQVIDKSLLSEQDRFVLNMLYMPIIGYTAVVLYLKFLLIDFLILYQLFDEFS